MIPTSFILTSTFVIFLLPQGISKNSELKSERAIQNNTSISIDLHLGQYAKTAAKPSLKSKKSEPKATISAFPKETIKDDAFELEEWMMSPITWTNKNEL
jgi:hypothetical protein